MAQELTWDKIIKSFKQTYPNLSKQAVHFCPIAQMTIAVYLDDGRKLSYNYLDGKANVLSERWKKDS